MVNAQEWLDRNYPKEERKEIIKLDINSEKLTGFLDLENFTNLTKLTCYSNELSSIDLSSCGELKYLDCSDNQLTDLELSRCNNLLSLICWGNMLNSTVFLKNIPNPQKLLILFLANNNFPATDLTIFSRFTSIELLSISGDPFFGSLKPLRDLKSMNILICEGQIAKISDFGISKPKTFQTTISSKNLVGTTRWMAPEILLHNQPHTYQSDIYSLGMIFWELVAKCTIPFKDTEDRFVFIFLLRKEREAIPSDIPSILKEIINGCWKEESEQRITLKGIKNKLSGLEKTIKITEIEDNNFGIVETKSNNSEQKKDKGKVKADCTRSSHSLSVQRQTSHFQPQLRIGKEKELELIINSLKTKLRSKSKFANKRQGREKRLTNLFNNLPATSETFITQLEIIKTDLGKRLNVAEIEQLYQVKQELVELESQQQACIEVSPK